jgi:hypothetical protein
MSHRETILFAASASARRSAADSTSAHRAASARASNPASPNLALNKTEAANRVAALAANAPATAITAARAETGRSRTANRDSRVEAIFVESRAEKDAGWSAARAPNAGAKDGSARVSRVTGYRASPSSSPSLVARVTSEGSGETSAESDLRLSHVLGDAGGGDAANGGEERAYGAFAFSATSARKRTERSRYRASFPLSLAGVCASFASFASFAAVTAVVRFGRFFFTVVLASSSASSSSPSPVGRVGDAEKRSVSNSRPRFDVLRGVVTDRVSVSLD